MHATGRRLLVCSAASAQFENLLGQFGGPLERSRWQALKAKLDIIDPDASAMARFDGFNQVGD